MHNNSTATHNIAEFIFFVVVVQLSFEAGAGVLFIQSYSGFILSSVYDMAIDFDSALKTICRYLSDRRLMTK